jgi:hypothetical protein
MWLGFAPRLYQSKSSSNALVTKKLKINASRPKVEEFWSLLFPKIELLLIVV